MLKKILLIVILIPLVWFTVHTIFIVWDGLHDEVKKADVILILGNKVEENGQPSERLKSRLDKGFQLYQKGYASKVVVSGGLGKEGFEEAEVMAEYLEKLGIPAGHIFVDKQGFDTYGSAKNLAKIMREERFQSVIFVSQYYHMSRIRLALNRVGIEKAFDVHADIAEWRDLYSIPREFFGFYYYLVR